jgi:hypothetical protein
MTDKNMTVEGTSFRPDQEISMTGLDYLAANMIADAFLDNMKSYSMPLRYKWIDKNDEPVDPPKTDEEGKEKELRKVFDPTATFTPKNVVESFTFTARDEQELDFEFQRFLQVIEAKRRLFEIHQREVDAGNAVPLEELMAEFNQPRTEVVE